MHQVYLCIRAATRYVIGSQVSVILDGEIAAGVFDAHALAIELESAAVVGADRCRVGDTMVLQSLIAAMASSSFTAWLP
ncbi:MAG TPA: hypothetical protein VGH51_03210 [Candidatus Angelobacter sp.]|jgi:hypothetical protein